VTCVIQALDHNCQVFANHEPPVLAKLRVVSVLTVSHPEALEMGPLEAAPSHGSEVTQTPLLIGAEKTE